MENRDSSRISARTGGAAFTAMMVLYFIITILGQSILSIAFGADGVLTIVISATFSSIAIIVVLASVRFKTGVSVKSVCGAQRFNPIYLLLASLFSASMFFGLGFVNSGVSALLEKLGLSQSSISFPLDNPLQLTIFSVVFALLPAVFEELFFRGIVFESVRGGGLLLAAIFSSLFFALYHCSIVQFFYQLIYGAGLCVLKDISKSVIPSAFCHFVNNFAVILLQYFKANIDLFNPWIIACGLSGLCAFTFICFAILGKRKTVAPVKGEIKEFLLPYGLIGGAACLALVVAGLF